MKIDFAKKPLIILDGSEMSLKVKEIEDILQQPMTIWDDDDTFDKYRRIYSLPIEERRLMIVFGILGGSVMRTAEYFKVDRKTISNRITPIINKIK